MTKKKQYRLKAEAGGLLVGQEGRTEDGAVVVTGQQLMGMTTKLLQRLDRTTAYLMSMQAQLDRQNWAEFDPDNLQQMINDNMAILDKFRKKEPKQ